MTHQCESENGVFTKFLQMRRPIIDAGKLGCILAQFPYSFHLNRQNQDYIEFFRNQIGDVPIVIEFRNIQWIKPEIFDWLRNQHLGYCCVDEPRLPRLIPPIAETTSNIAYLRFHGRNAAKWW